MNQACESSFDVSQLTSLENVSLKSEKLARSTHGMLFLVFQWLETVVMSWLTRIYSGGSSKSPALTTKTREAINKFKYKLSHFLYETYTRTRIEQLFNIIIGE